MNRQLIERTQRTIEQIATEHDITIVQIIIYGSQAREDHTAESDIDIVLVSPDWEGEDYFARPLDFLIEWPHDDLPSPDIIPVTPLELEERVKDEHDIIRTAIETGVVAETATG